MIQVPHCSKACGQTNVRFAHFSIILASTLITPRLYLPANKENRLRQQVGEMSRSLCLSARFARDN